MWHTFALVWDEDHDTRVIRLLEQLHVHQLLAPIRFIGERKGALNVLYDRESAMRWTATKDCSAFVTVIAKFADANDGDAWSANVRAMEDEYGLGCLVQPDPPGEPGHPDPHEKVRVYIENIRNLWSLGLSTWKQAPLPPEDLGVGVGVGVGEED